MRKNPVGIFLFGMMVALVAGLLVINNWIQGKVSKIVENPIQTSAIKPLPPQENDKQVSRKRLTGEVLKKTRMSPDRTYELSIFYQGGEEIARHKVTREGKVYDQSGFIPDGKVKFINETNETFGAEIYLNGKRHGPMRVFYKDGVMMGEANYQFGNLVTSKEYYEDGTIRMEVDRSDARAYDDGRDVGVGKVYFRNGRLKYEWKLTNSDPAGYQKSYNQKGYLTGETRYDRDGAIVTPAAPAPAQGTVGTISPKGGG